jgi:predicted ATP-grasp superfamily ATP-dependent carboligase
VNPRVWGWHTLGRRAGTDFTWLLWCMLRGEPVEAVHARPGVRWMRLTTDLPAAVAAIRRGDLKWRAYLRGFRPPLDLSVFCLDDPLPALLETPLLAWLKLRRGF